MHPEGGPMPMGRILRRHRGLQHYPVRQSDSAGQLQYGPGEIVSLAASFPMGSQPMPGETWYYQVFYRDPLGPCGTTFNATEALSVLWE